jgi:hypothetical protein
MTYSASDHSGGKKELRFEIFEFQRPEGYLDHLSERDTHQWIDNYRRLTHGGKKWLIFEISEVWRPEGDLDRRFDVRCTLSR